MGLSNAQLILLDNLIYLQSITEGRFKNVRNIIDNLLYKDGAQSNGIGTGAILDDWFNHNPVSSQRNMLLSKWIQTLLAIAGDEELCHLQVYDITENAISGLRVATFIGDDENIIIFRETSWENEWPEEEAGYPVALKDRGFIGGIVTVPAWFKLGGAA